MRVAIRVLIQSYLIEKKYDTRVVDQDGTKKTVHYVTLPMVSNLPMKQAEKYRTLVHQFAEQYRISPSLGACPSNG